MFLDHLIGPRFVLPFVVLAILNYLHSASVSLRVKNFPTSVTVHESGLISFHLDSAGLHVLILNSSHDTRTTSNAHPVEIAPPRQW